MKKLNTISKTETVFAASAIIIGTLSHFLYEWTGKSRYIGIIAPVNESVWEHLKLVFFPIMLLTAFESLAYRKMNIRMGNLMQVKVVSALLGMAFTVVVYYTYSGIVGKNYLIADIMLFIASMISAYVFSARKLKEGASETSGGLMSAWVLFFAVFVAFALFTFNPPEINLFLDPASGAYGTA